MAPPAARRPRRPRLRRDPQAARQLILAAAERLFAARGPDAVGLKEVARASGVSHALVSHYFGTYAALVDAVLERRTNAIRERVVGRLADAGALRPADLLDLLWELATDGSSLRLGAWALLSGRLDGAGFFPRRVQGLRLVVDAVAARLRGRRGEARGRREVEILVTIAVAFTYGYALTRDALAASLGVERDDSAIRERFAALIKPPARRRAPTARKR